MASRRTAVLVGCCALLGVLWLLGKVLPLECVMLLLAMVTAVLGPIVCKTNMRAGLVIGAVSGASYGLSASVELTWSNATWLEVVLAPGSATLHIFRVILDDVTRGTVGLGFASMAMWALIGCGVTRQVSIISLRSAALRETPTPGQIRRHSGFGIASLVIPLMMVSGGVALLCGMLGGILPDALWLICVFLAVAFIASVLGLVLGVIGIRQKNQRITLAVVGCVLNAILMPWPIIIFLGIG